MKKFAIAACCLSALALGGCFEVGSPEAGLVTAGTTAAGGLLTAGITAVEANPSLIPCLVQVGLRASGAGKSAVRTTASYCRALGGTTKTSAPANAPVLVPPSASAAQ